MTREIKFRAWVKEVYEDGEFAYGGYMVQPHEITRLVLKSTVNLMLGGAGTGIDYFQPGRLLPGLGSLERMGFDEIELMQYTGLKDKNGTEIYEGDIVQFDDLTRSERFQNVGIVQFGNASFYIKGEFSSNYQWINYRVEVIGNIYENADLL